MSFAAINDVTKGLAQLIQVQLRDHVAAATVTLLPPGQTLPEQTGVNLYLYRVAQSPHTRNDPWPGNRARPGLDRPALGLSLHYLLTPLGKTSDATAEAGDVGHTMLGIAMLTLHDNPVLNNVHTPGFDSDTVLSQFLLNSFEPVKITLSPATVEDLSKIWATINQPYRLSVAYEVELVELVSNLAPSSGAGIVTTPHIEVTPLSPPQVSTLSPRPGPLATVSGPAPGSITAASLTLTGSALGTRRTLPTVRVGGVVAQVLSAVEPFTAVVVALPSTLATGPDVDVEVRVGGASSEPVPFQINPWLSSVVPVRTALDPAAGADLTLSATGPRLALPFQFRFDGPGGPRLVNAVLAAGIVTCPIPGDLANGRYDIRIQLPTSELSNARSLVVIPRITSAVLTLPPPGADLHRVVITGSRLAGTVELIVDGVQYSLPKNAVASDLHHQFSRRFDAGDHELVVVIDGFRSRPVTLVA